MRRNPSRHLPPPGPPFPTSPAPRPAPALPGSDVVPARRGPSRFFEIAPVGRTCTLAVSRARSLIQVMVLGLSATGKVLGMQTTVVNPPAAAAREPDAIVSL